MAFVVRQRAAQTPARVDSRRLRLGVASNSREGMASDRVSRLNMDSMAMTLAQLYSDLCDVQFSNKVTSPPLL